jgi:3-mercaptopyruvate sulfurtransferase SseA
MFVNCETGLRAQAVSWVRLDRGLHREQLYDGSASGHSTDETPQRSAYRRWRELMRTEAGA